MTRKYCWIAAAIILHAALAQAAPAPLTNWPHITSAIRKDAALEARVARIVAGMTLAQKVGQMTQPEIKNVTPAQVSQYYLGSVLNGGGSWPNGNKYATPAEWVALADRYYEASMATDMAEKVPVIWGIDAIHGNSNVYGATLFPHNIGLGAAHNRKLVGLIGASVGRAVRATGINWVFAPTLAVVRDDRWGRTYESFSEDSITMAMWSRPPNISSVTAAPTRARIRARTRQPAPRCSTFTARATTARWRPGHKP
jgi:beta-glucosidase